MQCRRSGLEYAFGAIGTERQRTEPFKKKLARVTALFLSVSSYNSASALIEQKLLRQLQL